MNRGHRKKDRKRRFARIHNLTTRQRHDVRFRDEMLELAIQLTHLTQHYRAYICTISPVKSASPGIWLKARLSAVENRPTHSLKTSLTISPVKRAYRHQLPNCRLFGSYGLRTGRQGRSPAHPALVSACRAPTLRPECHDSGIAALKIVPVSP